jgi:ribonuclease-3
LHFHRLIVAEFQDKALMNPLEQRTGYKFRNSLLLAEALTHPSLGHETQRHHFDNQRLEFLGDAILQLIFTEHLYRLFPHFSEGQLTKLRSRLVSREGLKVHAINIGLGTYLMMGRGEEASGGRQRASILADAFEALVGAIYLDSNLEVVRRFVLEEAQSDIQRLTQQPLEVNPKGQLQEILQAISPKSPIYEIVSQTGPEHQKKFVAKVVWDGVELGSGEGSSKKQAETAAALSALKAKKWESLPAQQDSQPPDVASPVQEPATRDPAPKRAVRKRRKKDAPAL